MNLGNLREVFVHNMPKKKNLLHFLHRCHGFREMSKLQSPDPRRLAKALKRRKRPDPLQILAKASLTEHGTWLGTPSPNFKKFGENFVNCEFFVPKTSFLHQWVTRRARPFHWATPFWENSEFLDFSFKDTLSQPFPRNFTKFWASRKSKNKQKMTFCHIFDIQEAVLGDCNFGGANDHQIPKFHLGWKVDI